MGGTLVILHGTLGFPEENWFPWLADAGRELGYSVAVPSLPTPEGQSLAAWVAAFRSQVQALDSNTVLVGHSLGAAFALRLLERSDVPIRHTYLVGGFVGVIGHTEFDRLNQSFFSEPYDWDRVRSMSRGFTSFHGENDPYVGIAQGRRLADCVGARFQTVPGGGHLNTASGFQRFQVLLDDIRRLPDSI